MIYHTQGEHARGVYPIQGLSVALGHFTSSFESLSVAYHIIVIHHIFCILVAIEM
jgi:hypothetical protein